ncbi:hypothetical protein NPIL_259821 [Nephila pilipes]|uniref:Uncharacterized protein n=1 Tax=Nephila pilipes TaxID=299642 RepID=A0A8X6URZ0_NEPPI|nr:hypothetical protein NPIL_259821 [Nephila pilipes]
MVQNNRKLKVQWTENTLLTCPRATCRGSSVTNVFKNINNQDAGTGVELGGKSKFPINRHGVEVSHHNEICMNRRYIIDIINRSRFIANGFRYERHSKWGAQRSFRFETQTKTTIPVVHSLIAPASHDLKVPLKPDRILSAADCAMPDLNKVTFKTALVSIRLTVPLDVKKKCLSSEPRFEIKVYPATRRRSVVPLPLKRDLWGGESRCRTDHPTGAVSTCYADEQSTRQNGLPSGLDPGVNGSMCYKTHSSHDE